MVKEIGTMIGKTIAVAIVFGLIGAIGYGVVSAASQPEHHHVPNAKIAEVDSVIYDKWDNDKILMTFVKIVRLNGYRCDSVSGAVPYVFSSKEGMTLGCNHSKYSYSITDVGGNVKVEVN